MTDTYESTGLDAALASLEAAVDQVQSASLDALSPAEELALVDRLEVLRRRLDHGTDRSAGHLDRSAAFSLDGHKTAKGALKAIGRLPGSEAHGRVQTSRALRRLPLVEAAYAGGRIPTEHVRAIARTIANPRVAEHVPEADPIFAHHAAVLGYDDFVAALRQWEALADADGADQASEQSHERRDASLLESGIDGSFHLARPCPPGRAGRRRHRHRPRPQASLVHRIGPGRRLPPGTAPRTGWSRLLVARLRRPWLLSPGGSPRTRRPDRPGGGPITPPA